MIVVFGRTGQVAREIARAAQASGVPVRCLGREEADLAHPEACARLVREARASAVINAAAYTAVDRAEAEEARATRINGEAPAAIARACAARALPFVHVSTDYVFSGEGPHAPDAPTAPLGAYGRSKLAGERGVRAAFEEAGGGAHVVLRTAWVFSAHGHNFARTMLRLGAERDAVRVVDDQRGGPTPAAAVARALLGVAAALRDGAPSGTHHLAGEPDTSWAGFAREIMARAGLSCAVDGIATADYPTPAPRPADSRLDCGSLERAFGIARPCWRAGLDRVLRDLDEGGVGA